MKVRGLTFVVFFAVTAVVAACGPTVGDPCTTAADCLKEACINGNGAPGGYCSKQCSMDGMTMPCPTGTICVRDALSNGVHGCMRACNTVRDCRPTYRCERERGSDQNVCTGGL